MPDRQAAALSCSMIVRPFPHLQVKYGSINGPMRSGFCVAYCHLLPQSGSCDCRRDSISRQSAQA